MYGFMMQKADRHLNSCVFMLKSSVVHYQFRFSLDFMLVKWSVDGGSNSTVYHGQTSWH